MEKNLCQKVFGLKILGRKVLGQIFSCKKKLDRVNPRERVDDPPHKIVGLKLCLDNQTNDLLGEIAYKIQTCKTFIFSRSRVKWVVCLCEPQQLCQTQP